MTPSTLRFREEGVHDRRLGMDDERPISIFVPQKLEERYAYPLVVFLHGHGEDQRQWLSKMMQLSRRNYVGLGLRGPQRVVGKGGRLGYGWGRDRRCESAIEDYALAAIEDVKDSLPIDSRKVFLAGFGDGAGLALQLSLSLDGVFSKVVAFNGWLPAALPLVFGPQRLRGLKRPKILMGCGAESGDAAAESTTHAFRLLYAAGLDVELRRYSTADRLTLAMLRDVDRWLTGWW